MSDLRFKFIIARMIPSYLPENGSIWGTGLASALAIAKEVLRQLSLTRLRILVKFTWICLLFTLSVSHVDAHRLIEGDSIPRQEWFDFWVGEWDLTWEYDDERKGTGYNKISKILDGKVIEERFKVLNDTSMEGFTGRSHSVYNPGTGQWHQAWVDNSGGYFNFSGEKKGDRRIFKTEVFKRGGQDIQLRMVFYDITEDSFTWDWMVSKDGGGTWEVLWQISYKRRDQ